LAPKWSEKDLEYPRDFTDHDEYELALEEIIGVGLQNGHGFTPDQKKQIEVLIAAMKMEDSPLLVEFRQQA
jgi:hypothetical protein